MKHLTVPPEIALPEMFPVKKKKKKLKQMAMCMNCVKFWDCILLDTRLKCDFHIWGEEIKWWGAK